MAVLKRWKFAARSEQLHGTQRSLLDETIDADLEAIAVELAALQSPERSRAPTNQPKRSPLPAHLPRVDVRHEPEQTVCGCGCAMKRIGEDVSEKLDYTPGVVHVERHIRGKWACAKCQTLVQAPVPAQVIDKGLPTAGLLAQVLVAKYADHRVSRTCRRKEAWSCARDEGRPLAFDDQELNANRCKLLPLRAVVVSVAERAGRDPAWVGLGETSASKPPVNCRNRIVDVRTGIGGHSGISPGGVLKTGLCGIRLVGGVLQTPDAMAGIRAPACTVYFQTTIRLSMRLLPRTPE